MKSTVFQKASRKLHIATKKASSEEKERELIGSEDPPIFPSPPIGLFHRPDFLYAVMASEWKCLQPPQAEIDRLRELPRRERTAWATRKGQAVTKVILEAVLKPGELSGRGRPRLKANRDRMFELHVQGMSYSKIAQEMKTSSQIVKAAVRRERFEREARKAAEQQWRQNISETLRPLLEEIQKAGGVALPNIPIRKRR